MGKECILKEQVNKRWFEKEKEIVCIIQLPVIKVVIDYSQRVFRLILVMVFKSNFSFRVSFFSIIVNAFSMAFSLRFLLRRLAFLGLDLPILPEDEEANRYIVSILTREEMEMDLPLLPAPPIVISPSFLLILFFDFPIVNYKNLLEFVGI